MAKFRRATLAALSVLLIALMPGDVFACSCAPLGGSFLTLAPASALVIRGRVLRHTGEGETRTEMDIEVLETLVGKTSQQVVSVSGDPGNLCRPYVSWFPAGTEWVLALEPAIKDALVARQSYFMSEPDKGDYAISSCGAHWLKVKEGKVSGNIDRDDEERDGVRQEIPLKELRRRLEKKKKKDAAQSPAALKRSSEAGNTRSAGCIKGVPTRVARLSSSGGR
ncbi:MAG TPA: hypothetical protein VIQ24_13345 [Pyrinomonadaceae bacterium]